MLEAMARAGRNPKEIFPAIPWLDHEFGILSHRIKTYRRLEKIILQALDLTLNFIPPKLLLLLITHFTINQIGMIYVQK